MLYQTISRALGLSLAVFLLLNSAAAQNISVQLDGRSLQFDQPPAMIGGRLLVPLRGIFEALQADVVYDGPTRSIQATKGSRVVQLQLGSRTAIIDGRTTYLDVPADTVGGRTMVPLRFVSEALGADVKWEGATKTVRLSSTDGGSTTPPPNNNPPSTDGPSIDRVFHSATRTVSPGQSIEIIVYGEPGGSASFEILGSTKDINLPEVSSGKYQTRWTVPRGLNVEEGVLLAHLRKNGRETAVEADRSVTISSSGSGNNQGNPNTWSLNPANGATVGSRRPQMSLNFPSSVQNGSVRFYVDGVDFSNQIRMNGNQLNWQPSYDLDPGQHQAEVKAIAANGQQITQAWSFRIDPNSQGQGGALQIQELRPTQGSSAAARAQVGAIFNQNLRSVNLFVDGRSMANQPGVQMLPNGVLWTPNFDLAAGQHRATVQAVDQNGQVLNREWEWVVGASSITNFSVTPTQASSGQQIRVRMNGPNGASGTFSVGQVGNIGMREVSTGTYEGTYTVSSQDRGTAQVVAQLRLSNGQVLQTSPTQVTFSSTEPFTIQNLSNGMRISPVFNVQGRGQPGRTVSVVVEFSSSSVIGAITGQNRTIRTQGVVRSDGFYDVPVDASSVPSGQQIRVTASDGQNQPVTVTMTRQ